MTGDAEGALKYWKQAWDKGNRSDTLKQKIQKKKYIRCAFEMDGLVPNMVIKGTINSKLNEEFVFCKRID